MKSKSKEETAKLYQDALAKRYQKFKTIHSFEEASLIAEKLKAALTSNKNAKLPEIGLSLNDDKSDFVLKIRVETVDEKSEIPEEFEGLGTKAVITGKVFAHLKNEANIEDAKTKEAQVESETSIED